MRGPTNIEAALIVLKSGLTGIYAVPTPKNGKRR
jgi:hypothetical protein